MRNLMIEHKIVCPFCHKGEVKDAILRYRSTLRVIYQLCALFPQFRDELPGNLAIHSSFSDRKCNLTEILLSSFGESNLIAHGHTSSNSLRVSSKASSISFNTSKSISVPANSISPRIRVTGSSMSSYRSYCFLSFNSFVTTSFNS